MKVYLFLVVAQLVFAARLWSQAPTPEPSSDYVVVEGNFVHPGLVPYASGLMFFEAIRKAGGVVGFANVRAIYLVRCGKKQKIDLKLLRSDPSKEPVLVPWDIIYLPQPLF